MDIPLQSTFFFEIPLQSTRNIIFTPLQSAIYPFFTPLQSTIIVVL